jgi:hypothetical protein
MPPPLAVDQPAAYRIRVQGTVSQQLANYLDLSLFPDEEDGWPVTTITCRVLDQAALMGILNSLYGRGLLLLSVECLFS